MSSCLQQEYQKHENIKYCVLVQPWWNIHTWNIAAVCNVLAYYWHTAEHPEWHLFYWIDEYIISWWWEEREVRRNHLNRQLSRESEREKTPNVQCSFLNVKEEILQWFFYRWLSFV